MIKIWDEPKVDDNLKVVHKLRNKIAKLESTIENNRINYNNLQRRLAMALDGRDVNTLTTEREKELLRAIKQAKNRTARRDKRIKNLEYQIYDIKRNYQ